MFESFFARTFHFSDLSHSKFTGIFKASSFGKAESECAVDVDLRVNVECDFLSVWGKSPIELHAAVWIQSHVVGERTGGGVLRC